MKLIVGLGNPGAKYASTRDNIGRQLIESLARKQRVSFSKKKALQASVVEMDWEGRPVVLAYPETFMNVSGETISSLTQHFSINPQSHLLIAVDDFALPFAKLRLRSRGSDGGHNGLKSITQILGSSYYAMLRLVIG